MGTAFRGTLCASCRIGENGRAWWVPRRFTLSAWQGSVLVAPRTWGSSFAQCNRKGTLLSLLHNYAPCAPADLRTERAWCQPPYVGSLTDWAMLRRWPAFPCGPPPVPVPDRSRAGAGESDCRKDAPKGKRPVLLGRSILNLQVLHENGKAAPLSNVAIRSDRPSPVRSRDKQRQLSGSANPSAE